jgi:hypothetical protein
VNRLAPRVALLGTLFLGGCWKTEFAELPTDVVAYAPAGLDVPDGWVAQRFEVTLACPDGEKSVYYVVYPEGSTGALPAAVVYHSGSFDYVYGPDPSDPVAGAHFADPDRLTRDWSIEQIFSTLGMYPATVPTESVNGQLTAALARAGVAMILPGNCWGDWWHNAAGSAENQYVDPNGDYFYRNGRLAAEWGFRFLSDPSFAPTQQVQLPFAVDPTRVYAVGLGEGGRAIGELLNLDGTDDDAKPDYAPTAIVVDSLVEDFHPWYADPAGNATIVAGLNRIFPEGEASSSAGSLFAAPTLPDRTLYLFDPADPYIPKGAHARILDRMQSHGIGVVLPVSTGTHPVSDSGDGTLAASVVDYLLNGTPPPSTFTGTLDTGS